jgi:hypothetical protein
MNRCGSRCPFLQVASRLGEDKLRFAAHNGKYGGKSNFAYTRTAATVVV